MIRLLLEPVNFLILDEPTNHLDMRTKDVLKEAIRAFDGTAIIVSHDRDFLDGLVTKVYEFGGGKVREYLGGIYDFLEKNKLTSLADIQRPSGIKPETPRTAPEEGRLAYEQQKERAKRLRKLERTATEAEKNVTQLEAAVKMLESQMNDPANASDATLFTRHASMSKQLETAMSEWEKAEEELERFNAEN
jgi:ATP-binding cassette subfamily F protein 3